MTTDRYLERRSRLMQELSDGLILVRGRGAEGGNPSFRYLTGLDEPAAALLLAPQGLRVGTGRMHPGPDYVRGRTARQVLFLPAADPLAARWGEDSATTVESLSSDAAQVDAVYAAGMLNDVLTAALPTVARVYIVRGFPPSLGAETDPDSHLAQRLRSRFLNVEVRDGSPAVHEMRRLKDEVEVAAIRQAIDVTEQALEAALQRVRPGVQEYEVEAEIARVYRAHGGTHAFEPIVACGGNALKLHYQVNTGPVEGGELLLVDTGVSLGGYKSDITRTFPVDGKFSDRQREVYEIVLRAQREAIDLCRPGTLLGDVHARAFEVIDEAGLGEHFLHGVGHHIGLETHDVGDVHRPLEPGAVVTIEPGAYLTAERIGVRIEDDVLVTQDAPEVLSSTIPVGADAIERWMADARR